MNIVKTVDTILFSNHPLELYNNLFITQRQLNLIQSALDLRERIGWRMIQKHYSEVVS